MSTIESLLSELVSCPMLAEDGASAMVERTATLADLVATFRNPGLRLRLATEMLRWGQSLTRADFQRSLSSALGAPLGPLGEVFDAIDHNGTGVLSTASLNAGLVTLLGLEAPDAAEAIAARSPDSCLVSPRYFEEAFSAAVSVGLLVSTAERGADAARRARRTAAVHAAALRQRNEDGLTRADFIVWFTATVHQMAARRPPTPAQKKAKGGRHSEDAALLRRRAAKGGVHVARFESMRESYTGGEECSEPVLSERDEALARVDEMRERLQLLLRSA